jgi:hypothetical protein
MDSPDPQERGAPAAEDDVLGEAARNTGTLEPLREDPNRTNEPAQRGAAEGEAQPGKDENQAGFVKDADRKFSP